jgi:TonB family protein
MSLNEYIEGRAQPRKRQPLPLAISALLHVAAFFAILYSPEIKLPEQSPSAYKQAFEGKETKLVWYRFEKKLPSVQPPDVKAERKPVRAELNAPQVIVASRKDAPKRTQVILTPAPELLQTPLQELPNILAIRLPQITKPFVAPPAAKPPDPAKVEVPDAPVLEAKLDAVKVADAQRITRRFVPPPTKVPDQLKQVEAPSDAPQLEAHDLAPAVLNESFKAPTRPFTAPPARGTPPGGKQIAMEAPPDPIANSKDLSMVVAGLNPSMLTSALPSRSSPGQFSAGPKPRPEGADAAGDGKGFTVPDLYVESAKDGKNAKADLLAQAYAAPTSPASLRAAALLGTPRAPIAHEDRPALPSAAAVKVSGAPDKRFDGRDVYMMAIQMPNLTSYSGSWLMWYADRTAREAGLSPVAAPVPRRKVDPKYVASAQSDRVEGKIQLACVIGKDGHVSHVEMVRGLDERLNQTAQEAMAKWEFEPATRQGEPVEVDVLVEIPFKLEPFHPKSY